MSEQLQTQTVAYLTNQYPMPSHTFIRNELQALEKFGFAVSRFSVRGWNANLVDENDISEREKTKYLLEGGFGPLFSAALETLLRTPGGLLKAIAHALRAGASDSRGMIKHVAYLAEACLLVRWLAREKVQHVHVHFGTNASDVAFYASRLATLTYSFTVHGPAEFDMPQGFQLRAKTSRARQVIAISSFCRSQLYRWADLADWPRIHVVHCGLSSDFLDAATAPPPRRNRLVCVGRLCEQKGQLLLLDVVQILRQRGRDVHLTLAGDGPMRPELEEAIGRLDLSDRVTITGVLSNDEVKRVLLESDALIMASFAEGLPVVIMEAMALGRPIVSTNIAAIPELVREGREGFLVTPGDREALADAVQRFLDLPAEQVAEMARSCRDRVRERHSIMTEAAKLAALFRGSATP